ncbi:hypothetical protein SLEP1_g58479 [Rubroshorea leprosula]|uniref:Uncharacterized protein n=1 Tax=Rubroshorea leprosula TaxID=152421 RepID=A0AAV5MPJ0_9ROSI|nr:hypothetical protein SLEP1_g58479 [Rubroshorea leprosula]
MFLQSPKRQYTQRTRAWQQNREKPNNLRAMSRDGMREMQKLMLILVF